MGVDHTYRYVNASNVYNKGKADGKFNFTETVLWTNPDTNINFPAQTITLSKSMANYSYIKIYWFRSAGSTNHQASLIYSYSDFKKLNGSLASGGIGLQGSLSAAYNGYNFCRIMRYENDTSIWINYSIRQDASTDSNGAIPLKIVGLS